MLIFNSLFNLQPVCPIFINFLSFHFSTGFAYLKLICPNAPLSESLWRLTGGNWVMISRFREGQSAFQQLLVIAVAGHFHVSWFEKPTLKLHRRSNEWCVVLPVIHELILAIRSSHPCFPWSFPYLQLGRVSSQLFAKYDTLHPNSPNHQLRLQ